MSWFSTNYEKVVLGAAIGAALGLAYLGWSKHGSVETDFSIDLRGRGNNQTAVRDADLIPQALASLKMDHSWLQALDMDRPVDLFTGIPLFIKSSAPDEPIDLLKDAPVHPPIPNIWWIQNRLDPGYADTLNRDPDHDGFSNVEEFKAKTDPNSARSLPSLITKLMFVKEDSLTWVLRPGYGLDGSFPIVYEDSKGGANKAGAAEMIAPGTLFFSKGVMANRFKLLGSEVRKELNKKINIEMEQMIVRIEDQRPNKKGTVYELPAPLSDQRKNDYRQYDRTAIFSLEALGLNGKEFKVEENTTFALPPSNPNKNYLVKAITPESVTIEFYNAAGDKKTLRINKGRQILMPE